MTKKPAEYTICRTNAQPEMYAVLNPSGVIICHGATWRTARKIADALNAQRGQS